MLACDLVCFAITAIRRTWHKDDVILGTNMHGYDTNFINNGVLGLNESIHEYGKVYGLLYLATTVLRLLDSFQFTQQTLKILAVTLKDEDFVYTKKDFS